MAYEIMEVELIMDDLSSRCEKTIHSYKTELSSMKAGRANSHILDKVTVEYYGVNTPIQQLANITIPEARLLLISVWDQGAVKSVEKAIIAANLGINPSTDGKIIRMVFPELTEERRRNLVKDVKNQLENTKIALRNIRRDAMDDLKALKKDSIVTEDEMKTIEKDIEKVFNNFSAEGDKAAADKEKEIMSV